MALTKITGQVVDTTTDLVVGVTTVGGGVSAVDGFFSGIVTFSQGVSIGGTLTYEDVTNIDSVGIITARSNILVGSGITLSPDGHVFTTGISTISSIVADKISLGDGSATDGDQINIGVGSDLKLYHNGSHSHIDNNTGNLMLSSASHIDLLNPANDEYLARFQVDGSAELYENGLKKLETDSSGVTVTGRVAATSYTGDGSSLTGISVGITTEEASISGITTYLDLSKDDHELYLTGTCTISVIGGAQGSSHTLRLQNSAATNITLDSTYFKFPSGATPTIPTSSGAISLISFTVHKAGAVGVNTVLLAGASVDFS